MARLRQYQPIWLSLKANKTVTITAPQSLHKRIIKAVIKEKDLDKVHKLEVDGREVISWKSEDSLVTFTLKIFGSVSRRKLNKISEGDI